MQANNGYSFFILGLGVGAAAALLFAPKSGADSRKYLQSKAEDAAKTVKDQTSQVIGLASESIDRGKAMLREQVDNVSTAIDSGKRAYHEAVEG
jgi:gas vesicle protein